MSLEINVYCDGCGTFGDGGPWWRRAHIIRAYLKTRGWLCSTKGGKDYCSDCKASGEHKKDEQ